MELKFEDVQVDLKNNVVRATAAFTDEDANATFTGVVVKGDRFIEFLDGLAQEVQSRFVDPRWAEDVATVKKEDPETKSDDIDLDAALGT
jgi:hypothetical protein